MINCNNIKTGLYIIDILYVCKKLLLPSNLTLIEKFESVLLALIGWFTRIQRAWWTLVPLWRKEGDIIKMSVCKVETRVSHVKSDTWHVTSQVISCDLCPGNIIAPQLLIGSNDKLVTGLNPTAGSCLKMRYKRTSIILLSIFVFSLHIYIFSLRASWWQLKLRRQRFIKDVVLHTRIFLLFFLFNYLFMSTKWIYPGCWMDPYDVCFSVMLGWSSNFVFVHGRLVLTLILNFRSFISDWNMEFFNEMSLKLETSYFKHNILVPSSSFKSLWNSWYNVLLSIITGLHQTRTEDLYELSTICRVKSIFSHPAKKLWKNFPLFFSFRSEKLTKIALFWEKNLKSDILTFD